MTSPIGFRTIFQWLLTLKLNKLNQGTKNLMAKLKYFGTDGIRGTAGISPMSVEFVERLGWAAGKVFGKNSTKQPVILIGRDTREVGTDAAGSAGERFGHGWRESKRSWGYAHPRYCHFRLTASKLLPGQSFRLLIIRRLRTVSNFSALLA